MSYEIVKRLRIENGEVFKNLLRVTEDKKVIHTRRYYYPIQYAEIELTN